MLTLSTFAHAQTQTTGVLLHTPEASDTLTLVAPSFGTTTYLIQKDGTIVNEWTSKYRPGLHGYLLEDGSLIRAAQPHDRIDGNGHFVALGGGGLIERFDWAGNKVWEYAYDSASVWQHHDFEILPNGNLLMIAWELMTEAEATAAGRDPDLPGAGFLYPDHIIEVEPDLKAGRGGKIVWQWHVKDHLVQDFDPTKANWHGEDGVAAHPELIDINYVSTSQTGGGQAEDWTHANGIDYHAGLDQIALSVREFSEFWIIDHSTTTQEAAGSTGGKSGKGGNLLYRWGNPEAYGAGDADDRQLFFQHDAQWVPEGYPGEGHITVFDNGYGKPGTDVSSVLELDTGVDKQGRYAITPGKPFGPASPTWNYEAPVEHYSPIISGTQRLKNGNTLMTFGGLGMLVEVTRQGEAAWTYVNPFTESGRLGATDPVPPLRFPVALPRPLHANFVFRATDYSRDYFVDGLIAEGE